MWHVSVSVKLFFLLTILSYVSAADQPSYSYFTSVKKLRELVEIDRNLFSTISGLSQGISDEILQSKLAVWRDEIHTIESGGIAKYVENPLNAFKLIKRNFIDLIFYEKTFPDLTQTYSEISSLLPTKLDLVGAVKGLIRLQKFYKLKTKDLVTGIIDGIETGSKLSTDDIKTIANELKAVKEPEDYLINEYLNQAHQNYQETDKVDPFDESFELTGTYSEAKENVVLQKMCRGEIQKSSKEQSKLHCRFHSTNAFTLIAPFKVEQVNAEPEVLIFVDILSKKEITDILHTFDNSKTTLDSTIGTPQGRIVSHRTRIAALDKFYDADHDVLKRITTRLDDMTGLFFDPNEPFQVIDYGIGGHFSAHWDMLVKRVRNDSKLNEDRVQEATFLFYLSDVELGGATVLPYTKTLIKPKKGSAVFWFNFKDSGNDDYYTRHAGCPVLMGNKVVMKKWVYDVDQIFKRPCVTLEPEQEENEIFIGFM